jgi:hypothetical protein
VESVRGDYILAENGFWTSMAAASEGFRFFPRYGSKDMNTMDETPGELLGRPIIRKTNRVNRIFEID